ncbi:MAG: adenylate/guanylate cyclase domain-containing protein [Oceanococcus sp.]
MNQAHHQNQPHWYRLRFNDPQLEADYKPWRLEQALPLIMLAGAVSLPVWIISPIVFQFLLEDLAMRPLDIFLIYGLVVPGMILGMVLSRTPLRQWALELGAVMLAFTGIVLINTYAWAAFDSVGLAVVAAVMFALFAPLMRLPLLYALLAQAVIFPPALWSCWQAYGAGEFSQGETYGYIGFAITTAFVVSVMSVVNELSLRQAFLNERELAHQRKAINRYLPRAVAQHILDGRETAIAEPVRRRVTIMFADIAGFTQMADRVEPEVMTEVLSEHLSSMAGIIESHGGTLNEFAGDGLMALFGAPDSMPPEEQARQAIAAAQAMQAQMPLLNQSWRKLGLGSALEIRIGINTGMVSVGSYGSDGRMTYTAIGLQTNIASRIESKAEPGEILISDASYQLISEHINCEPKGEVECKGVHFPVKVYAPVEIEVLP